MLGGLGKARRPQPAGKGSGGFLSRAEPEHRRRRRRRALERRIGRAPRPLQAERPRLGTRPNPPWVRTGPEPAGYAVPARAGHRPRNIGTPLDATGVIPGRYTGKALPRPPRKRSIATPRKAASRPKWSRRGLGLLQIIDLNDSAIRKACPLHFGQEFMKTARSRRSLYCHPDGPKGRPQLNKRCLLPSFD